jgi:hypothetical protein
VAKRLTRWSAKPVFAGSIPARCSNKIEGLDLFRKSKKHHKNHIGRIGSIQGRSLVIRLFTALPYDLPSSARMYRHGHGDSTRSVDCASPSVQASTYAMQQKEFMLIDMLE